MIGYRGPFVLQMPEKAWFDVNMQQKDMKMALELGRKSTCRSRRRRPQTKY